MQYINKINLAVFVTALILGAALTRYYAPRVETKVEIREAVKVQKDVQTVTKYIRKDGSVSKEVVKQDKSVVSKDKKVVASKTEAPKAPDWFLTGSYNPSTRSYGVGVNRRVLGPVFLGLSANTQSEISLNLSIEF